MPGKRQYRWYTSGGYLNAPVMIKATSDDHAREIVATAAVTLLLEGKDIGKGVITIQFHNGDRRGKEWKMARVLSVSELRRKADSIRAETARVTGEAMRAADAGGGDNGGGETSYRDAVATGVRS